MCTVTAVGNDGRHALDRLWFDRVGGTMHKLVAVVGDSGGGCFAKRDSTWELVGLIFAPAALLALAARAAILARPRRAGSSAG